MSCGNVSDLRVISYGGGWQSTALLVLAAARRIDFRTFLFANVGDDSEKPETLRYIHNYAMPFARENGIDLVEVKREWRDGREFESIYGKMLNAPEGKLREPIPVRGENGAPLSRSCTLDWKVLTTGRWCKRNLGASPDNPVVKGLGYSLDEVGRVNPKRALPFEILTYPLIGAPEGYETGLRVRRSDCPRIITDAGLPVPPKSHCWFCPMHSLGEWHQERREHPERFARSVALERLLNERRDVLGKPHVYLTRFGAPLDQVVLDGVDALPLADDELGESCAAGGCFT